MLWKLNNPTWNKKGVLENLTISLNHWLVPKKPKPKETFWQRRKKRFQRRFSWTHIKKNWQLFVFMGFIFTVNVILFVTRAVYFRWESLFNNSRERKIGRDLRIDFKADIEKYIQYLLSTLHCGKGILSEFSPLTAEDIWFLFDLHLKFITPINIWKKCIDLRLFSKCLVWPFLRPLRSKDNQCWILRLQPQTL